MAAVEVKIYGIVLDEESKVPVIILKVVEGVEKLYIQVGIIEASAIAAAMEDIKLPRPMTHDLLANVITSLGGTLQRVEVTDLKDSTFYASLYVKIGKRIIEIDSRPSDAIATAVRLKSPIFVNEAVFKKVEPRDFTEASKEKWIEYLSLLKEGDSDKLVH